MNANDTALAVAHTSSGAETLAKKVRKAHVVSEWNPQALDFNQD